MTRPVPRFSPRRQVFAPSQPSRQSVAVALQSMAILVDSGVPLADTFAAVRVGGGQPQLARILCDIEGQVARGDSLSQAFSRYPEVFPPQCSMFIRAAEMSGDLAGRLRAAGDLLERQQRLRERVWSALLGPAITLAAASLLLLVTVKFVMPRFAAMYTGLDLTLPWLTRGLIMGLAVVNHWAFWFLLGGVVYYLVRCRGLIAERVFAELVRRRPFRRWIGSLLAAQFCDVLASLVRNGVPMVQSLRMLSETAPYRTHRQHLRHVHDRLLEEGDLAEALAEVPYFPPVITSMAAVSAEAGSLDVMLASTSRLLAQEVELTLNSAVRVLEPLLLCGLGVVMMLFFVAMFWPVYDLVRNLI